MQRLPPADRTRLQAFALSLNRLQQQLGLALPVQVTGKLISLFDA